MRTALILPLLFACAHPAPKAAPAADLPGRSLPALQAGDRAFSGGDIEGALRWYGRAIAAEPRSGEARYLRARAYLELDDVPSAEADLDAALRLSPAHWEARCLLGILRQRQGRPDEAAAAFRAAAVLAPREEAPRNDLAFLALLEGKAEAAYQDLRVLARDFPRSPRVWNNLAIAAERTGRRSEATAARAQGARMMGASR